MSKGVAVIYDRASTAQQKENYTRQDVRRIGSEIARQFGYEPESEPRFEIKSGEELRNREVMLGILDDIKTGRIGKIGALIVPGFTRLSRDEDNIDGLIIRKTCRDNDVVVIDFNGKVYNFANDNDQDTAFLEFWFASRDKREIMSKTMRGLKERASQGKFMGGYAPLGFKTVESGEVNMRGTHLKKRIVDPDEAKLVRRIYRMIVDHSAHEVALQLNTEGAYLPIKNKRLARNGTTRRSFRHPDIIRIVTNPLYAGWNTWNAHRRDRSTGSKYLRDFEKQAHFDASLQIITQDEFDRVQRIIKERAKLPARAVNSPHPFSRILKCHECGGIMGGEKHTERRKGKDCLHDLYRCTVHHMDRSKCPDGQSISARVVASVIIPFVAQLLGSGSKLADALNQAAKEYSRGAAMQQLEAETRAELEKTGQGIQKVVKSVASGLIEDAEAKATLQELREKKDRLTRDLQSFEESETVKAEILEAISLIQGDVEGFMWKMLEDNPRILSRVMRIVFEPHSVVVEGRGACNRTRQGELLSYKLQAEFAELSGFLTHSPARSCSTAAAAPLGRA